jgi:hypothetical protein
MTSLPFSSALNELVSRNSAIAAAYREWARRLPPGPSSKLASSMAEQRLELGKTLGEIAAAIAAVSSLPELVVEFEIEPFPASLGEGRSANAATPAEPKEVLRRMAETEAADYELLAAAAGAVLPLSSAVAEQIAAEAGAARKRATWAQDHLDLLGMA